MAQERIIGVRVDDERHAQFERAARNRGKKVSEWLRDLGVAAIEPPRAHQLEARQPIVKQSDPVYEYDEGGPVEDVKEPEAGVVVPARPTRKLTRDEILSSIPTMKLGSQLSPAAPIAQSESAAPAAEAQEPDGW